MERYERKTKAGLELLTIYENIHGRSYPVLACRFLVILTDRESFSLPLSCERGASKSVRETGAAEPWNGDIA